MQIVLFCIGVCTVVIHTHTSVYVYAVKRPTALPYLSNWSHRTNNLFSYFHRHCNLLLLYLSVAVHWNSKSSTHTFISSCHLYCTISHGNLPHIYLKQPVVNSTALNFRLHLLCSFVQFWWPTVYWAIPIPVTTFSLLPRNVHLLYIPVLLYTVLVGPSLLFISIFENMIKSFLLLLHNWHHSHYSSRWLFHYSWISIDVATHHLSPTCTVFHIFPFLSLLLFSPMVPSFVSSLAVSRRSILRANYKKSAEKIGLKLNVVVRLLLIEDGEATKLVSFPSSGLQTSHPAFRIITCTTIFSITTKAVTSSMCPQLSSWTWWSPMLTLASTTQPISCSVPMQIFIRVVCSYERVKKWWV